MPLLPVFLSYLLETVRKLTKKPPCEVLLLLNLVPIRMKINIIPTGGFLLFEKVSPGNQWVGKVMYGGVVFRLDPDGIFRQAEALYLKQEPLIQKANSLFTLSPLFL